MHWIKRIFVTNFNGMKKKSFFVVGISLASVFVLSTSCDKDDDSENSNNQEESENPKNQEESRLPVLSVDGSINGHDYVDLGLTSGTLWATTNVGGSEENPYGDYFSWAVSDPIDPDNVYGYYGEWSQNINVTDKNNYFLPQNDAATKNWGEEWAVPQLRFFNELKKECEITRDTLKGISGVVLTGPNGHSMFLPFSGCFFSTSKEVGFLGEEACYWTTSVMGGNLNSWYYCYSKNGAFDSYKTTRNTGLSIRPIVKKQD